MKLRYSMQQNKDETMFSFIMLATGDMMGQTDWDRVCVKHINLNAKYFNADFSEKAKKRVAITHDREKNVQTMLAIYNEILEG